jgi:ATP phosphoribosyltransferase
MKLKLAVQKSGRLHEESIRLLKECSIDIDNGLNRLKIEASNFPLEVLYLRDDDIPQYVEDGVADIGIVGQNVLLEKGAAITEVLPLGFGKCRLALAVPKGMPYDGVQTLQGKKIATTYPRLLQQYLDGEGVQAELHSISGSVEIAPNVGLAHAIADLVSSGSTLFQNGLEEKETILRSEAVLVKRSGLTPELEDLLAQLLFRIKAVKKAKNYKYILLNAPNEKLQEIIKILPGMKSPTVLPLAEPGWSSIHTVVQEQDFWRIIQNLTAAGAQGILVTSIEKMVL